MALASSARHGLNAGEASAGIHGFPLVAPIHLRVPCYNWGFRAVSSVGRAPRLHRGCREFEPLTAHHSPAADAASCFGALLWVLIVTPWCGMDFPPKCCLTGGRVSDTSLPPLHQPLGLVAPSGGVAQLVRVPACHAGGRGFEPRHSRHFSNISNRSSPGSGPGHRRRCLAFPGFRVP